MSSNRIDKKVYKKNMEMGCMRSKDLLCIKALQLNYIAEKSPQQFEDNLTMSAVITL
jgi:hypothetical protein